MAAAQRLEPIYNELRELVKDSYYVMADETPHPVLESDWPGAAFTAGICGTSICPGSIPLLLNITGRGSAGIDTLLAGQVRVVQSDGFAVYDKFDTLPGKLHLCWAHVRQLCGSGKEMTLPEQGMHLTNRRTVCRGGENQNGTSGRGGGGKASPGKIVPYYQRTGKWCKEEYGHTVDNRPIAKAMFYMYTRFEQLSGYVNDAQFLH